MKIFSERNYKITFVCAGIGFAVLWASASAATKVGLISAQPLTIAVIRFAIAAFIMLLMGVLRGSRVPRGKEWKQLAIYGLLNISIYLGCYVVAMQTITAGIGTLAVATNPVLISFLSVFFLHKKLTLPIILSLILCSAGVCLAAWPLFSTAVVSTQGLLILILSMISYSAGAIYFSSKDWRGLSLFTINGWQTLLGGIFLLPLALIFYKRDLNHFDIHFWGAVLWLAIPVSIFAVLLWLWLLKTNAIKAGLWLFLCPLFGFIFAAWLLHDSITGYTIAGVALVILGLFISYKK